MLKPLQLHTPRLLLRPATALDLEPLQHLWPEVDLQAWRVQARGSGLWLIALVDNRWQDIGCVALRPSAMAAPLHASHGAAIEPLVILRPEHRGHGYAQEALKAVLWHAQSATTGRCFVATCDVPNTAADRLLRCLGFVPGYEADAGRWRVRQYRLPTARSMATP
jgi:RimJ/RimL family protein N-acetyltransferase